MNARPRSIAITPVRRRGWSSPDTPHLPADASVGQRIRAYREWRGVSRPVLAGQVRRSESWLYQVEHGVESRDERLGWRLLSEIARVLGVTVDELLGQSAERRPGHSETQG